KEASGHGGAVHAWGKRGHQNALYASAPAGIDSRDRARLRRATESLMLVSRTPPLRRTDIVQVQGRSNQSEMRKRLRKITDLPLRLRVVFFRKQADIVANRQQTLEQGGCFGVAVLQRVIVGKPKAAREKYPF